MVPIYHWALCPANVPAHLEKRRIQLLREQLPLLTSHQGRPMARPQAHPRPGRTHWLPGQPHHPGGLGTLQDVPPPYGHRHTSGLVPGRNLRQHEGWPTYRHAHQATVHLFRDPLVKEATLRGVVTQALHRHLTKHSEPPMEATVHLQLEAVRRATAQMVHRKHLLLTHTQNNSPTPPPGNTCSVSSITMPCMTQKSTNLPRAPDTPHISVRSPPRHHQSTAESLQAPPQDPPATSTHGTPGPTYHPRGHPASPSPAKPAQGHPYINMDARSPAAHPAKPPRTRRNPPSHRPSSATPTSSEQPSKAGP